MSTINAIEQSTYKMCYRGDLPSIPFIKYKNIASMYLKDTETERTYTLPLNRGKRLVQQNSKIRTEPVTKLTQVRPTSNIQHEATSKKVFETKFGPMDMPTIDALYNKRRYSTSSQTAAQECAIPILRPDPPTTTQEPKADMVRLRGQRYEETRESWQDAVLWDRVQSRFQTQGYGNITPDRTLPMPPSTRDRSMEHKKLLQQSERKCPGYSGYIPLCPPETRLDGKISPKEPSHMTTSYRKFPDNLYKRPVNGIFGMFSKTVTLTSPLNPYSQVGRETVKMKSDSRYLRMKDNHHVLAY